ncbi:DUF4304 domain-containing protein [Microvirga mediterraneensis]|uniref:DUF4304 domain-containing protein n=1 Tax=Microvirga mediterraneensis TaxID=2754695 RepID=A0A838BVW7_9HYPH|nr:DUF4304 domain-containing protein [Microvirga mediterraneensis]MBA1158656.1 DUF4304 domain-containing protein [Microvirga mediterraneensis]
MNSLDAQLDSLSKEEREIAVKELRQAFDARLRPHGFKRDALTWRLLTPDAVCLVNIQKSAGGGRVYVNLGILLRWIEDIQDPKEYECHLRSRIAGLCPPDLEPRLDTVSYTDIFSKSERLSLLVDALEQFAIPAMLGMATREAHHKFLESYENAPTRASGAWGLAQPAVIQKFRESKS